MHAINYGLKVMSLATPTAHEGKLASTHLGGGGTFIVNFGDTYDNHLFSRRVLSLSIRVLESLN